MADRLVVEALRKTFANKVVALDDVSFAASPGTLLVLLGPSGSGKTTLLRAIAGIERVSSGRIVIGDRVVADDRTHHPAERRGLSMVFQDYALWPHLQAVENVAFALRRHRISAPARRAKAASMMERVGLGHLCERYPGELSGGEQQRVALARALVAGVGLVLCDEPLSNLDADLRERMRVEISELVRESGATAVYITHDQSEAFALADEIGVLERGRLVQVGEPEVVYSHPATPFVARFTGAAAELRVRVPQAARAGAVVDVEPVGLSWSRPIRGEAIGAVPAGAATLLVRPAAARLCSPGSDGCHVVGTVTDVAFRGRGYELAVDLLGGGRVCSVAAAERVARGETVGLQLGPGGCLVFAGAETETGTGAGTETETGTEHGTAGSDSGSAGERGGRIGAELDAVSVLQGHNRDHLANGVEQGSRAAPEPVGPGGASREPA